MDDGSGDMAEEGFLHATGGRGGFEELGGGRGTFGTTGSEDEMFDSWRASEFGCDLSHRGILPVLAIGGIDGRGSDDCITFSPDTGRAAGLGLSVVESFDLTTEGREESGSE